jgi:tight adherence protein C
VALYLVLVGSFLFVFLSIYGSYVALNKERLEITKRMQETVTSLKRNRDIDNELNKPFFERVIRPFLERMSLIISKSAPAKKKIGLQKKLMMAGNPGNLAPGEVLAIQYFLTVGIPICFLLLALPLNWSLTVILISMTIGAVAGFLIPDLFLKSRFNQRKEEIQDNLPDVLDLLTVSVEAGLGFDAALVKVVEKIRGVVSHEFSRVLQEIKMGKPKRDALRDLGSRSGVDDLVAFVGAIIQADQLGVSIGNVLRIQSEQMRQKRRQRAEEKAMKAPIKMLIPLILFIFPTIFIVVLGPAALQIINTF